MNYLKPVAFEDWLNLSAEESTYFHRNGKVFYFEIIKLDFIAILRRDLE